MLKSVILGIFLIFMAINTNIAIEKNSNIFGNNKTPIINTMVEPPGGFRLVDLAPTANCSLTGLNFTDNSRYIGQIIFSDSYWTIGPSNQAVPPRKVTYKKILEFDDFNWSINKDGTATKYDIGLYVVINDTSGKKIIYENKAITTKVIYKTPSITIQDVSLEDRCVLTPKKPLQFGSNNENLGMQVAEEYYGPGVEFENGIYFFNPEKAGVGDQTVYYSAKSLMEGSSCKRIVSRTIKVHPALLIEGKEEVQINTRENIYKTKMNIRVQDPESRLVEYEWSPVIGLSNPKELTPEVVISNDISYKLIAKAINGDNAYNCIQEKIVTFRIIPCIDKVHPISNYITPNADGINDTWVIEGIEKYDHSIIKIYNRSGQLIWASKGYDNPWKGEHKSGQVIPGTYYYTIDLGVNVLNSTESQCPSLYTGFIQVVK